jgi:hypothetical protein
MSKIIVDQIQKNGGDVLTLPATDATANNQALVGSTTGALTFSPLALPAADGAANKPVTTDGAGQLQFGGFALPAGSGSNGQVLTTNGTAASWASASPGLPIDSNSSLLIGTVETQTARGNAYSTSAWNSTDPKGNNYSPENAFNDTNDDVTWNLFLGDGDPHLTTGTHMFANNHFGSNVRVAVFAHNNRVGNWWKHYEYIQNNTSYGGHTFRVLPIRNSSNAAINVTVKAKGSSYTSQQGTAIGYYTPSGSGTLYSQQTGGSWTSLSVYSSNNVDYNHGAQTVPVPANTTVLVMLVSTHSYRTTAKFPDTNQFYDLATTFSDSNITCDIRILSALQTARCVTATDSVNYPYTIYTAAAALYGDR